MLPSYPSGCEFPITLRVKKTTWDSLAVVITEDGQTVLSQTVTRDTGVGNTQYFDLGLLFVGPAAHKCEMTVTLSTSHDKGKATIHWCVFSGSWQGVGTLQKAKPQKTVDITAVLAAALPAAP